MKLARLVARASNSREHFEGFWERKVGGKCEENTRGSNGFLKIFLIIYIFSFFIVLLFIYRIFFRIIILNVCIIFIVRFYLYVLSISFHIRFEMYIFICERVL